MNQRKEEDTTEADFIIRSYTKAELAQLYCPGLDPVLALQKLYRWMRPSESDEKYGGDRALHSAGASAH